MSRRMGGATAPVPSGRRALAVHRRSRPVRPGRRRRVHGRLLDRRRRTSASRSPRLRRGPPGHEPGLAIGGNGHAGPADQLAGGAPVRARGPVPPSPPWLHAGLPYVAPERRTLDTFSVASARFGPLACGAKRSDRKEGSDDHPVPGDRAGDHGGRSPLPGGLFVQEHPGRATQLQPSEGLAPLWAVDRLLPPVPDVMGRAGGHRVGGLQEGAAGSRSAPGGTGFHLRVPPVDAGELAVRVPPALLLRGPVGAADPPGKRGVEGQRRPDGGRPYPDREAARAVGGLIPVRRPRTASEAPTSSLPSSAPPGSPAPPSTGAAGPQETSRFLLPRRGGGRRR